MVYPSYKRTKVFISYSHKDVRYLDQLVEHLTYYERNNLIEFWSDKKIAAGAQWHDEIKQAIEATKVAVLLISPSFLASKFIAENELPTPSSRRKRGSNHYACYGQIIKL